MFPFKPSMHSSINFFTVDCFVCLRGYTGFKMLQNAVKGGPLTADEISAYLSKDPNVVTSSTEVSSTRHKNNYCIALLYYYTS